MVDGSRLVSWPGEGGSGTPRAQQHERPLRCRLRPAPALCCCPLPGPSPGVLLTLRPSVLPVCACLCSRACFVLRLHPCSPLSPGWWRPPPARRPAGLAGMTVFCAAIVFLGCAWLGSAPGDHSQPRPYPFLLFAYFLPAPPVLCAVLGADFYVVCLSGLLDWSTAALSVAACGGR
jgi:hypothetical protein